MLAVLGGLVTSGPVLHREESWKETARVMLNEVKQWVILSDQSGLDIFL
jgi:hypothetical protein